MPVTSKAQVAAFAASRAAAVEQMTSRLGDMTPQPGQFAVTIRVDRPDGQFVTSTRLIRDDLSSCPWAECRELLDEVFAETVSVYRRAAELSE